MTMLRQHGVTDCGIDAWRITHSACEAEATRSIVDFLAVLNEHASNESPTQILLGIISTRLTAF